MNHLLMSSILTSLLSLFGCQERPAGFKTVDAGEFAKTIADTTVVVLDVRTAEEYEQGHISRAMNVDVLQSGFSGKVSKLVPKGKTIALYCRSGNRSKKAAAALCNDYSVIELGTGYNGWLKHSAR
ncbi:MAG: rhodanese-like domain-containing protein [Bacteroidales bacterium]|nr:rhodanese-like domain-containing protein [Bacteroidales bacterium]